MTIHPKINIIFCKKKNKLMIVRISKYRCFFFMPKLCFIIIVFPFAWIAWQSGKPIRITRNLQVSLKYLYQFNVRQFHNNVCLAIRRRSPLAHGRNHPMPDEFAPALIVDKTATLPSVLKTWPPILQKRDIVGKITTLAPILKTWTPILQK